MNTNHGDSISVNATVQVVDDHLMMLGNLQSSIRFGAANIYLGKFVLELARCIIYLEVNLPHHLVKEYRLRGDLLENFRQLRLLQLHGCKHVRQVFLCIQEQCFSFEHSSSQHQYS